MNIKKGITSLIFSLVIAATATAALSPYVAASELQSPLSPALYILAKDTDMAMAALRGNTISFTDKDFCRAMNLSKIDSVTITQAPQMTDGELRVGTKVISSGHTLSRSEISSLTYTPTNANINNSFVVIKA